MKTKFALPVLLAGSVTLTGCFLDDDDNDSSPSDPRTSVRVLHASANAPAVNVKVDGLEVVSGADYKQAAVINPTIDTYTIEVDARLPGDQTTTVIGPADVTLEQGLRYDVIAVGRVGDDAGSGRPLEPLIVTDDGERDDPSSVRLRVAHLSPDAQDAVDGPVQVFLSVPDAELTDDGVLSFSFEYKDVQDPIEVPAGNYRVRVAIPGEPPTVVYDSGSVALGAGADLLVAAVDNTSPETTPDDMMAVNNSPISLIAVTGDGTVLEFFDQAQEAGVRVVHNSSDAPEVQVLVDDAVAISNLAFPDVAPSPVTNGYAVIDAGARNLKVAAQTSMTPVDDAVIDADVTFDAASAKTVVAVNSLADIEALVLSDSVRSIATQASLRVVHGAVEAGTVDVYLVPTAEGGAGATVLNTEVNDPTLDNFAFKANTGYLAVAPDDYVVFITDQSGNELLKTGSVTLEAGGVYTAIARLAPEDGDNVAGLTLLDDFVGD